MDQIHNEEKLPSNIYMIGDNPASVCNLILAPWMRC